MRNDTGRKRAATREAEKAKSVATLYQHTPRFPETRQVRRRKVRTLEKARVRADKVAARRVRKKARTDARAARAKAAAAA